MEVRTKLKAHLVMSNISQRDVAKSIKMHYTTLNCYLNGRIILKNDELKRICKALKLNFEQYKKGNIVEEVK